MVRERNVLEDHAIVILVEGSPTATAALHGKNPINSALHRLALIPPIGMFHLCQSQAYHGAIVHVRIEFVVKFEVPAARYSLFIFYFPIARIANLLLQNPISAFDHTLIIGRHTTFAECKKCISRVPQRGLTGLDAEGVGFFYAELFEFVECANDLRVVYGIAQAT